MFKTDATQLLLAVLPAGDYENVMSLKSQLPKRLILNELNWSAVESAKAFIRRLFSGPPPDRPGAIIHPPLTLAPSSTEKPSTPDKHQMAVWEASHYFMRRPLGLDDFVPTLGTGAGTCAMATAFGAEEISASGVQWVKPAVRNLSELDHLHKPGVTDGKLGSVLDQTRSFAKYADERIPIRIMDFQSPFTTVEQLVGSERFFTLPYDEPSKLKAAMDVVTDFAIEFFKAQMEAAGPSVCRGSWPYIWFPPEAGIQMSDDNLVNVSPEIYEEFVVPYNNRVADAFGGLFLHSCTIHQGHLPAIKKIKKLTGINCDISSSLPVSDLMEAFGTDAVVAPHCYINTGNRYRDFADFTSSMLGSWKPGLRLFIYPCTVMYMPALGKEIACDSNAVRSVLESIPAWRRDHSCLQS